MLFSIIVPVYNVEKYLCECVDSVLKQTYKDFELILVDDGSTDRSSDICDEYAKNDNRIKVVHKQNGGQSTARNAGVEIANGKFAVFIDSDDMLSDVNFLRDIKNLIDSKTDVVIFRYCKYYDNGKIDNCGINLNNIKHSEKQAILKELVKRDAFFCSCWSKCVRLDILKENNIEFDTNLSCEDMDWYYSVVFNVNSFKVIDKPYVYYRQRENSVTSNFKKKSIVDYIFTLEKWK